MKKHIPNIITCCNLLCGCIAATFVLIGEPRYDLALAFIIGGAVFDFFDGFAARLLHVSSPIGKELDSLADDITFGLAPGAIVYALIKGIPEPTNVEWLNAALPYAAFLISAFSALRLAKFNLDERQTTQFIGLPTPANTLFWASLALGSHEWIQQNTFSIWLLLAGVLLSSLLLISEIPMFALKFKSFGWKGNSLRYTFIIFSAIMLALLGWIGFAWVIVLYIVVSVVNDYIQKRG